jgi:hypothetical protein
MKLAASFLCSVLFIVGSFAQNETVTEGLLAAQADLSLSHSFFETVFAVNREQISDSLHLLNEGVISSHIDTYAFIKNLGIQMRAEIDAIEVTPLNEECVADLINRLNLQLSR